MPATVATVCRLLPTRTRVRGSYGRRWQRWQVEAPDPTDHDPEGYRQAHPGAAFAEHEDAGGRRAGPPRPP